MMPEKMLRLDQIRTDGDTQPRAEIDNGLIEEYAGLYAGGTELPPVIVFHDGADYWLADGFHRYWARQMNEAQDIECDIRKGTQRDAQWYSFGANKAHGKRRQPGDVRRILEHILTDKKWAGESQQKIAEHVGCAQQYVSKLASQLTTSGELADRTRTTGKDGRTRDTSNIGRKKAEGPLGPTGKKIVTKEEYEAGGNGEAERESAEEFYNAGKPAGKGVRLATEAIAVLDRIPQDDPLRDDGFALVLNWIDANK